MIKNKMLLKSRAKFMGLIFFVVSFMSFILYDFYSDYQRQKERILETNVSKFESRVNSTVSVYGKFSSYVFEELKEDSEVFEIMYKAYHEKNELKKDEYRREVYSLTKDKYKILKKYNFRQFHFHFANGDSFLRVHKPEKYGDNLFSIRETVKIANLENRVVKGFEEGRIYNGYRFVYPVNVKGEHIGSVEISLSMGSIVNSLFSLYNEDDFYFVIDKEVVNKKVFPEMQVNYTSSNMINGYFLDRIIFEQHQNDYKYSVLNDNDQDWLVSLNKKILSHNSFSLEKKVNGEYYIVSFLNIKNIKNKNVAYLISISQSKGLAVVEKNFFTSLTMLAFIFISFVFAMLWSYYNRLNLKKLSNTDFLTKLNNRHAFTILINYVFLRSKKQNLPFSIIIFDIDFFKKVNDQYGHNVGDLCLVEVAELVTHQIRKSDICARWGGEEFVILLPNTTEEQAVIKANKLVKMIETYNFSSVDHLTISAGVAEYSHRYSNPNSVINLADRALYHAKENGRNQVTAWSKIASDYPKKNNVECT